jgi:polysaccharide pyruvyl transferase WcaK-like protein
MPRRPGGAPIRLLHLHATCRNLGDAAIVRAIRALVSTELPGREAQFVDVTLDRDSEGQRGAVGFLPLYRFHQPRWWGRTLAALRTADAVVIGGGELLSGGLEFLGMALLGWARGIPVVYLGIGVELSATSRLNRYYTRFIVRRGRFFVTRDVEAAEELRRMGVSASLIRVAPDVALADLAPSRAARRSSARCIGVSLRPGQHPGYPVGERELRAVAGLLDRMVEAHGARIVLFPLHPPDPEIAPGTPKVFDQHVLEAMTREMRHPEAVTVYRGVLDPDTAVQEFAQLDGLLAMRLHAAILGLKAGVLPLVIEYAPKIRRSLDRVGIAHRVVRFADLDDPGMPARVLESFDPRSLASHAQEVRRNVAPLLERLDKARRPSFVLRFPLVLPALLAHGIISLYAAMPSFKRLWKR